MQAEVNFSAAPLDNVALAKVFHQEGRSYCRGLLFVYQDGAQRALGDCRVGVDPYETYETPRTLYILTDIQTGEARGERCAESKDLFTGGSRRRRRRGSRLQFI